MNPQNLEQFLKLIENNLYALPYSDRIDILSEIKSHLEQSSAENFSGDISQAIVAFGSPREVALRYLDERGMEFKPQPKQASSVSRFFKYSFITIAAGLLLLIGGSVYITSQFLPIVEVDEVTNSVKILGGIINVSGENEVYAEPLTESKFYVFNDTKNLSIKVDTSSIKIEQNATNATEIKIDPVKMSSACVVFASQNSEGDVDVEVKRKQNQSSDEECDAKILVKVPTTIKSVIKSGTGNVEVLANMPFLKINSGTGDFKVVGNVAEFEGKSGTGNVQFEGMSTVSKIKSGSGDINVKLLSLNKELELKAHSGTGDVRLNVPSSAKFRAEGKSGTGNVKLDVLTDKHSKFALEAKSGTGNVSIRNF